MHTSPFSALWTSTLLAALLTSACASKSRRSEEDPAQAAGQATGQAAEQTTDEPPAATGPAAPPADTEPAGAATMQTLAGQLAREAARRPSGQRVEDAFAALAQAGLTLVAPRQYLAVVASADYCAGGVTDTGLSISACEYADGKAAALAVARTERRFPQMVSSRSVLLTGRLSVALSDA
ncbi:MAG TPA: hypothetical protein PKU97_00780, partial [Kofleriaceae bacterium]|nr:hypothetical protein [Kofleriaceae bacterium]